MSYPGTIGSYYKRMTFNSGMTAFTFLLLPALGVLFFFLPGMSAVLAFSDAGNTWRGDVVRFITSSAGLSIAITLLTMFALLLVAQATQSPFKFLALPAVLAVITAAFLLLAAFRRYILKAGDTVQATGGERK